MLIEGSVLRAIKKGSALVICFFKEFIERETDKKRTRASTETVAVAVPVLIEPNISRLMMLLDRL